jgi:hypothetical protein
MKTICGARKSFLDLIRAQGFPRKPLIYNRKDGARDQQMAQRIMLPA